MGATGAGGRADKPGCLGDLRQYRTECGLPECIADAGIAVVRCHLGSLRGRTLLSRSDPGQMRFATRDLNFTPPLLRKWRSWKACKSAKRSRTWKPFDYAQDKL